MTEGMTEGMAADPRSMSIRLQDGRRLGYADLGDPDGHPTFYFHGWPGSRLDPIPVIGAAERAGVRLLSVDRPGFGLSDPSPGRALSDWPKDVGQLADHFHLDRFSVVGWSGGGPSAAACAWAMPDRVHSAGVVAGWSQMREPSLRREAGDRFMLALAARAPALLDPIMGLMSVAGRHLPNRVLMAIVAQGLADSDKKVLADPNVAAAAAASGREAFAQGRVGATDDIRVTVGAWGFELEDIVLPLYLWEGADDHTVPPSVMADYRRISHNQYVEFPGEGHMIFYSRAEEIFRTLVRG